MNEGATILKVPLTHSVGGSILIIPVLFLSVNVKRGSNQLKSFERQTFNSSFCQLEDAVITQSRVGLKCADCAAPTDIERLRLRSIRLQHSVAISVLALSSPELGCSVGIRL